MEAYAKANILWRDNHVQIAYTDVIEPGLGTMEPTISRLKRPRDKILSREAKNRIDTLLNEYQPKRQRINGSGADHEGFE